MKVSAAIVLLLCSVLYKVNMNLEKESFSILGRTTYFTFDCKGRASIGHMPVSQDESDVELSTTSKCTYTPPLN